MVRLHNIPLLRRKTHSVFTEEIQLVQFNSTTVNSKLSTMIRNIYGYKTYNHTVFAGFLPGFISVHGCFYSVTRDKTFFPNIFCSFTFTMAQREHTYTIPDSTVMSLHLLCGPDFDFDFPDAVPFHVTEMACSPSTDTGKLNFYTSRQDTFRIAQPLSQRASTFVSSIHTFLASWHAT